MVIIINFHGVKIPLKVVVTDSISNVKTLITYAEGIPRDLQHLTYHNMQLEDEHTLSDYNIHNEDTLDLLEKVMHIIYNNMYNRYGIMYNNNNIQHPGTTQSFLADRREALRRDQYSRLRR